MKVFPMITFCETFLEIKKYCDDIFRKNLLNEVNKNQYICKTKKLSALRANNNNKNCHITDGVSLFCRIFS